LRDRLKQLSTGVAIYGAGDAAIQTVNLVLLALYVKGGFLAARDLGALAVIGALEAFAKVVSRAGLDGAFMRHYHDKGDDLPRFSSTIVWFLIGLNVLVSGGAWVAAGVLGLPWFDSDEYTRALQLMFVNTGLIACTFIPFHGMRMRREAATYSAFTFARSIGTVVCRIAFVIGLGWGLLGWYLADLVVTLVLVPLMWPWTRPFVGWVFSAADLRVALRFGLPRVPHGLAQQAIDGGNKLLLGNYLSQAALGVYQIATTIGTGVKFFTSAFETAWAPFYYATSREPDAKTTLARMTTYAVAALTLIVAGTAAVADDLVRVLLTPEFLPAARVAPIIAVGLACHGLYLLTSIGLNLSSRTEFYPMTTFVAAAVGLGSGVVLMARYGAEGAAVAFALSYATMASLGAAFSQRLYPIQYEGGRLARILIAGVAATLAARWLVPVVPPIASLLAHAATTVAVYGALLWASGFMRASERRYLSDFLGRSGAKRATSDPGTSR
jgi:O-antigen/teichoic acid export membrane protein